MTDATPEPILRDPIDHATQAVADAEAAIAQETPCFTVEFGDPCCDWHVLHPDAPQDAHRWWPTEETHADAGPLTLPDGWKAIGWTTTEGADVLTAPVGTPPPKIGQSRRRLADDALRARTKP